ncbi:MAG: N-formylglutamate amidohydrolase [Alphaproteobacteria bacterium]|nr:MAG: N-formylglutamate amidohydrolase [Alphaproteobacteria bacterium]
MAEEKVLICQKPARAAAPLVLDSPHSGNVYPEDFGHACPKEWLEETEDAFVHELFGSGPAQGVPLLSALFPRCYIDANRAEDDIDPLLLEAPWPGKINPSARSSMGMGLIRRLYKTAHPEPIYDRFLSPEEVEKRLSAYYRPYHSALEGLLEETYSAFGAVWHLNCHSMPATASGLTRHAPDIVLGDRDGTTCDAAFTRHVAACLKQMGYRVAVNRPYKGVEIVRRYADPARNRHSLQIELKRSLYMDEQTRRKTPGFAHTRQNMTLLISQTIDFTRKNTIDLAAD